MLVLCEKENRMRGISRFLAQMAYVSLMIKQILVWEGLSIWRAEEPTIFIWVLLTILVLAISWDE